MSVPESLLAAGCSYKTYSAAESPLDNRSLCSAHYPHNLLRTGTLLVIQFRNIIRSRTLAPQSFFAVRVYRFSKRIGYTLLSCGLSLVRLGTGIAIAVLALPLTLPEFVEKYTWLIITSVCVGDVVDIGNTIAICYCLNKAKHEVVRYVFILPRRYY